MTEITQETERPLSSDEDDNIPLIAFANNEPKKHVYRWRKNDIPMTTAKFTGSFSNPPEEEMTPLEYFYTFLPQKLVTDIVEQTNLYSVQRSCKSVNTKEDEMKTNANGHSEAPIIPRLLVRSITLSCHCRLHATQ